MATDISIFNPLLHPGEQKPVMINLHLSALIKKSSRDINSRYKGFPYSNRRVHQSLFPIQTVNVLNHRKETPTISTTTSKASP